MAGRREGGWRGVKNVRGLRGTNWQLQHRDTIDLTPCGASTQSTAHNTAVAADGAGRAPGLPGPTP